MATEERLAAARAEVEKLQAWKSGVLEGRKVLSDVVVRTSGERKLKRFSGNEDETEDWIEDAECAIVGLSDKEAVSYLKRHLEGVAREEVKLYPECKWNTPAKLLSILRSAFGEKRSEVQLKKLIYERTQRKHETLRSYSRALQDLVQRLSDKIDKNAMLCEVFCDNVNDKYLRVELKQKLRDEPNLSFIQLREYALQISEEDADCCRGSAKPEVMHVQYGDKGETLPAVSNGEMSAIRRLEAQVVNLANLQQQMLEILGHLTCTVNTPQVPSSSSPSVTRAQIAVGADSAAIPHCKLYGASGHTRGHVRRPSLSSVQCYYCREYGHYKGDCPKRKKSCQSGLRGPTVGPDRASQTRVSFGKVGSTDPMQVAGEHKLEGNGRIPLL